MLHSASASSYDSLEKCQLAEDTIENGKLTRRATDSAKSNKCQDAKHVIDISEKADTNKNADTKKLAEIRKMIEMSDSLFDEKPQFPGGDDALYKFICVNLRYPGGGALEIRFTGRITLKLTIDKNGKVVKTDILRRTMPEQPAKLMTKEILRMIELLPNFIPGKKNGQPVESFFILPMRFNDEE